ncbi:MAG TPA: pilin [Candidatus Saccharimonadales bacterium]|nr:pilin [Candidatus Saccharimonadales bacterium]
MAIGKEMIAKIKILFASLGIVMIGGLICPLGALAATSAAGGGGSSTKNSAATTGGVHKNPDPCHPELDSPPGAPLTQPQLNSCEACNNKKNPTDAQINNCLNQNPIVKDINLAVNGLAGMVAVVSVAMIVLGGIKYSLARNNPQEISNARNHIINAVFAMIAFMLIWALLQYLVPGGVFNNKS